MAWSDRTQMTVAVAAVLTMLAIGTIFYHSFEHWTWIESFYFSVSSLTTVGYGDIHPTTDTSRLFTAFYLLVGVSIVLAALGSIGSSYLKHREEHIVARRERRRK